MAGGIPLSLSGPMTGCIVECTIMSTPSAYLEVDLRYLVPLNSLIHTMADADKTGTRIAVPRGDLVDVLLSKRLKQAELVRADTVLGAFELLQTEKTDVCALPLPNLIQYSARLPGSRILDERFGVNRVGIVVPKGHDANLTYFSEFIESAKTSGLMAPPSNASTQ